MRVLLYRPTGKGGSGSATIPGQARLLSSENCGVQGAKSAGYVRVHAAIIVFESNGVCQRWFTCLFLLFSGEAASSCPTSDTDSMDSSQTGMQKKPSTNSLQTPEITKKKPLQRTRSAETALSDNLSNTHL